MSEKNEFPGPERRKAQLDLQSTIAKLIARMDMIDDTVKVEIRGLKTAYTGEINGLQKQFDMLSDTVQDKMASTYKVLLEKFTHYHRILDNNQEETKELDKDLAALSNKISDQELTNYEQETMIKGLTSTSRNQGKAIRSLQGRVQNKELAPARASLKVLIYMGTTAFGALITWAIMTLVGG